MIEFLVVVEVDVGKDVDCFVVAHPFFFFFVLLLVVVVGVVVVVEDEPSWALLPCCVAAILSWIFDKGTRYKYEIRRNQEKMLLLE